MAAGYVLAVASHRRQHSPPCPRRSASQSPLIDRCTGDCTLDVHLIQGAARTDIPHAAKLLPEKRRAAGAWVVWPCPPPLHRQRAQGLRRISQGKTRHCLLRRSISRKANQQRTQTCGRRAVGRACCHHTALPLALPSLFRPQSIAFTFGVPVYLHGAQGDAHGLNQGNKERQPA